MRGTPQAPARDLDRLPRLTGLRAVAALVVFAHHARLVAEWRRGEVLEVGYLGVSLFFVLSGFVLAWATRPGDSAARFYRRRFARIYPAYVVGVALAVLLVDHPPLGPLLANLALVQAWVPDLDYSFGVSSPNWSLSCEAFFYAAFPLVLGLVARRGLRWSCWALGGWWALTNAATVALSAAPGDVPYMAYAHPVLRSGEFALGILGCGLVRAGWRPPGGPAAWGVGALALAVAGARIDPPFPCLDVLLGPVFAGLVVSSATADRAGRLGWVSRRPVVYGGQVSYCFYLVHLSVLYRVAGWGLPAAVYVAVGGVAAVAVSVALHHGVERPFQRWLSGRPAERAPAI